MKKIVILFFPLALILFACGPSRDQSVTTIREMEKQLFSSDAASYNKAKADSLMSMYVKFVKENPADSLAPDFLFRAAGLAMNSGDGTRALNLYDQFLKDYPTHQQAAMSLFFKAFVYENLLHNLDYAREAYLQFIEKYPNDEFNDDARLALQNLGKTPDQMIREFEEKQRADSARIADSLAKTKKRGAK